MTGTIKCKCSDNKVVLKIGDASIRMKLECGCCDCRQALEWAHQNGGPKLRNDRPPEVIYFGNDILVESGKENLKWFKLRDEGTSMRWVAECCFTTMVFVSPFYLDKIFATYSDIVEYDETIPRDSETVCRFQMTEYPKDLVKNLAPFSNGGKDIDIKAAEENLDLLNEYGRFGNPEGMWAAFQNGTFFDFREVEQKIGEPTSEYIREDENNITVLRLPNLAAAKANSG